jgi:hypothetical protein
MIEVPLPWNRDTLVKIKLLLAQNKDVVSARWWWEPFHRTGFNALKFAATRATVAQLEARLDQLSCVSLPVKLQTQSIDAGLNRERVVTLLKQVHAIDDDERLLPLDPARSVHATWQAAQKSTGALAAEQALKSFAAPQIQLATVADLREILGPLEKKWEPKLVEETEVLSKWLTSENDLLKRFQKLDPWSKLELLEALLGVAKSSSVLHFQRIVD